MERFFCIILSKEDHFELFGHFRQSFNIYKSLSYNTIKDINAAHLLKNDEIYFIFMREK